MPSTTARARATHSPIDTRGRVSRGSVEDIESSSRPESSHPGSVPNRPRRSRPGPLCRAAPGSHLAPVGLAQVAAHRGDRAGGQSRVEIIGRAESSVRAISPLPRNRASRAVSAESRYASACPVCILHRRSPVCSEFGRSCERFPYRRLLATAKWDQAGGLRWNTAEISGAVVAESVAEVTSIPRRDLRPTPVPSSMANRPAREYFRCPAISPYRCFLPRSPGLRHRIETESTAIMPLR